MGCNVSKEHQVDQVAGSEDAVKTASGKAANKNKKCNKKCGDKSDGNCVGSTGETDDKIEKKEKGGATTQENGNAEANKEEDMEIDPSDPELNAAAAKIQASFRGHKVRKELKKTADEIDLPSPKKNAVEEEVDIDLNDPEVEKAATKIQASFRGYRVRKQVKDGSNSPTSDNPGDQGS